MKKDPLTQLKEKLIRQTKHAHPHEPEFHQAVSEVVESTGEILLMNDRYLSAKIFERMIEPERIIVFRVPWMNDSGGVEVNIGYRVQFSSALGPYKGGLRFHPSVNLSVLKFLGFEQIFKNALTGLPLGGGKGGANFDPKGKSDAEVMRFCQAFMSELARHIGADIDVPAGDIGVGGREIGYLFGQYKKLQNEFTGVLTGKGYGWGGSLIRPEATGYGVVYFVEEMLARKKQSIKGKTIIVSGSGNVAQGVVEKANMLGAKVLTMSDSDGYIYDPAGIDEKKLAWIMDLKNVRRGRIKEYTEHVRGSKYVPKHGPWSVQADIAIPCATQNEVEEKDVRQMTRGGVTLVAEGANMPLLPEAIAFLKKNKILYAPGKASNAGGVATSGLEMSQNSQRIYWGRDEVDKRLRAIMGGIHETCVRHGFDARGEYVDYEKGANIGGFLRVADAMMAQGLV